MKKKLLFLAIIVIAIMSALAISASAAIIPLDTDPGLDCDASLVSTVDSISSEGYTDTESRIVLTDGTKFYVFPAYYVIPNSSTQYTANRFSSLQAAIADQVTFSSYKEALVRVQLPTYITEIKQGVAKFENHKALKEVRFGTHLTKINAQDTFSGCSNLEFISDISHMTVIDVASFSGCSKLSGHINWPAAVKSIGRNMFSGTAITSITIPEGVTSIGTYAFSECKSLTEVTLPNSLTTLAKMSFGNCTKLVTVRLGAGFTTFTSNNTDYEIFYNTSSLKYVYVPAAVADNLDGKGRCANIFNAGSNVTFFFVGSKEKAEYAQGVFSTATANTKFSNATLVKYDENQNYIGYADKLGKNIIVYDYNACEAFYGGEHDYQGTGLCVDGFDCKNCDKTIAGTTGHEYVETATYANGYTQEGLDSVTCSNEGCKLNEKTVLAPIFTALAENGYSTNGTGIAFGGYTIDTNALAEYNRVQKANNKSTLTFGVAIMNPKYVGESFFVDGAANSTQGFIVADLSDTEYSNVKVMIDGLAAHVDLELVISLYAYTDSADVEFIQSADTNSACSKVEKNDATLYTVSLTSVVDKPNTGLDMLPPYNKENA